MTQAYMIESVFPWLGRERFYLAAESTASLLRETLTEARFAVWELDGRSLLDDQSLHWHVNQWLNLPQTCLPAPRVDADALRFFKADVPVRVAVLWHHPERTASRRLQLTAISYIAHTLPAVLHEYGGRSFAQLELFLLSDEPGMPTPPAPPAPPSVTELSSEHGALMPAKRDEWIGIRLSAEPADRGAAAAAMTRAYEVAGLKPPEVLVWVDSPLAAANAAAVFIALSQGAGMDVSGDQVWDEIHSEMARLAGIRLNEQVSMDVRSQVSVAIQYPVGSVLLGSHRTQDRILKLMQARIWREHSGADGPWQSDPPESRPNGIRDRVVRQVRAQAGERAATAVAGVFDGDVWRDITRCFAGWAGGSDQTQDIVGRFRDRLMRHGYGHDEAAWLAFYDFFRAMGMEGIDRLAGLQELARSAGWWWAFERLAIISERPCRISQDDEGRPHADDGPALEYRDGFAVYAWHGLEVDPDVILRPDTISVAMIRAELDPVMQSALIDRFGRERFRQETGPPV